MPRYAFILKKIDNYVTQNVPDKFRTFGTFEKEAPGLNQPFIYFIYVQIEGTWGGQSWVHSVSKLISWIISKIQLYGLKPLKTGRKWRTAPLKVCRYTVGQQLADCRPTVGQQSEDSFLGELFFIFSENCLNPDEIILIIQVREVPRKETTGIWCNWDFDNKSVFPLSGGNR